MIQQYSAEFKKKVVLEILRGESTIVEIASKNNINQRVIQRWKADVLAGITAIFQKKPLNEASVSKEKIEALEQKVGQLVMENEFLKKNSSALL